MGKLFWGFFFIYINLTFTVNGHVLNFLPPFVGYLLLLRGMGELDGESGHFRAARPLALVMTVYTALFWLGNLLGVTESGGWLRTALALLALAASLYVSWSVIQGVRDLEDRQGRDLNGAAMGRAWRVLAVTQAVSCGSALLQWGALALAALLAGLVGIVLLLAAFWRGKKLYEVCPPAP